MPARPETSEIRRWLTTRTVLRVPRITIVFWIIKALSTATGESTSDYLVHVMAPVLAVLLGLAAFLGSLHLQFRAAQYIAWTYWLTVVMLGTFGTMAADVLHVGLGVPYPASTLLYGITLAAVFVAWWRTEKTLSFHSVDTPRREIFYWAAVVATFAMGTALGDFTAYSLSLGYFPSAMVFAALILCPIAGYQWLRWNAGVAYLSVTRVDVQPAGSADDHGRASAGQAVASAG